MKNSRNPGFAKMRERGQIWTQNAGDRVLYVYDLFKVFKVGFCEQFLKTLNNSAFREMALQVLKVHYMVIWGVFKAGLKNVGKKPENGQMSQPRILRFRGKIQKIAHRTHGIHGKKKEV